MNPLAVLKGMIGTKTESQLSGNITGKRSGRYVVALDSGGEVLAVGEGYQIGACVVVQGGKILAAVKPSGVVKAWIV